MMKVPIHSRAGNMVLAVVGAVYVVSALIALTSVIRDAMTLAFGESLFHLALVVALAYGGLWLLAVALGNLGVHVGRHRAHNAH